MATTFAASGLLESKMLRENWRQPIHWLGMAAFAAAWLLASPAQAGQDYKDTHWGVAFTIPDRWSQDKISSSQAAVSISRLGKGFRENVNLQVFPVYFEDGKRMRTAEFMKQVEQGM